MLFWGLFSWFRSAIEIKNKKFWIRTLPPVLVFGSLGIFISSFYFLEVWRPFQAIADITSNVACNLVLGLLLVFRTNAAYDRFWQGRTAWGTITVNIRNLAREMQLGIIDELEDRQQEKTSALKLLGAFVITTKFHLRQQTFTDELNDWIEPHQINHLQQTNNAPLAISFWMSEYIQQAYQRKKIDSNQLVMMISLLNELIAGLTSCDRIRTTPVPMAYRNFLKKLLLLYCSLLPFSFVEKLHWWTGLSVTIISLILLGMEEIANEIEEPFGNDDTDLPLDEICQMILNNIESVINVGENKYLAEDSRIVIPPSLVNEGNLKESTKEKIEKS